MMGIRVKPIDFGVYDMNNDNYDARFKFKLSLYLYMKTILHLNGTEIAIIRFYDSQNYRF